LWYAAFGGNVNKNYEKKEKREYIRIGIEVIFM